MTTRTGGAVQASVSVEDISRQYYESAGYSMWITAMHVDPLELIANDDSNGKAYRIPVELSGDKFTFGDAQEVAITYVDVKSAAAAKIPHRWGSKAAALAAAGKAPDGTDLPDTMNRKVDIEPASDEIAPDVTPAGAAIRKMASATKTPDVEQTADSTDNSKEASVDAAKIREALGLSATASDDEVKAAALAAFDPAPTPPASDDLTSMAALAESGQAVLVDKAYLADMAKRVRLGEIAYTQNRVNERDSFLSAAVREGRIPPASLSAYEKLWDNDPEGTRKTVSLLARNIIPVAALGFMGQELDLNEADKAYEAMGYGKAGA
jgi:Mu-like prophage I protein